MQTFLFIMDICQEKQISRRKKSAGDIYPDGSKRRGGVVQQEIFVDEGTPINYQESCVNTGFWTSKGICGSDGMQEELLPYMREHHIEILQ